MPIRDAMIDALYFYNKNLQLLGWEDNPAWTCIVLKARDNSNKTIHTFLLSKVNGRILGTMDP